jgi:hypothetical protein
VCVRACVRPRRSPHVIMFCDKSTHRWSPVDGWMLCDGSQLACIPHSAVPVSRSQLARQRCFQGTDIEPAAVPTLYAASRQRRLHCGTGETTHVDRPSVAKQHVPPAAAVVGDAVRRRPSDRRRMIVGILLTPGGEFYASYARFAVGLVTHVTLEHKGIREG